MSERWRSKSRRARAAAQHGGKHLHADAAGILLHAYLRINIVHTQRCPDRVPRSRQRPAKSIPVAASDSQRHLNYGMSGHPLWRAPTHRSARLAQRLQCTCGNKRMPAEPLALRRRPACKATPPAPQRSKNPGSFPISRSRAPAAAGRGTPRLRAAAAGATACSRASCAAAAKSTTSCWAQGSGSCSKA